MKNNNYTLITGGSYGIGLAIATQFAKHGHNLLLVARNKENLLNAASTISKAYNVDIKVFAIDLTAQKACKELFTYCEKEKINIDIIINNAGFGSYGFFAETDSDTDENLIQLNITVPTTLTKLILPTMIKNKKGHILNVGSMASFFPGPFMNTYFSSKAYILSFSEALREELKPTGVKVSCLCPGPTESKFGDRCNYEYSNHNSIKMTAKTVAHITYNAMKKNKSIIIPGWKNKLLFHIRKLIPRSIRPWLVKYSSGYSKYEISC